MVYLHHLLATVALADLTVAHLMGLVPREFDAEKDVDLGVLDNMDAFFEAMGTNSSEWENITPEITRETLGALPVYDDVPEAQNPEEFSGHTGTPSDGSPSAIFAREDWKCDNAPEWGRFLCDNMPNTNVFWAFGAILSIRYVPRIFHAWLDDVAMAVYGGNLYRRYRRQTSGAEGPTRRDQPFDARIVHFKLEELPSGALSARDLDMQGHESHVYTEYKYDTVKGELSSNSLVASLSNPGAAGDGISARESTDYNILLDITKNSRDSTSASRSCIAKVIKHFINRSTSYHRHSCQQMHNSGSAMYHVGVHINEGAFNAAIPRQCC